MASDTNFAKKSPTLRSQSSSLEKMGLSKFILTLLTREQIVSTFVNADVNDEESATDNSTSSHISSTVLTSWTFKVDENF